MLTLSGHGDFLSVACEVSCRIRTGDVRPYMNSTCTASPRAVPDMDPEQRLTWFPRSCRARW
ncbi:hypothetical protein SSAG_05493 [Streptomyces sp. Mg1]|nr:hypothetical protein SSAG_05493 [Streptomyces sp. Mg1]